MTLKIGKVDIGSDGNVSRYTTMGNHLDLTLNIYSNVSTHLTTINEQFRWADKVNPINTVGRTIFMDKSPFKTNVVYLDITDIYTGWAIIVDGYTAFQLSPNFWKIDFRFYKLDSEDIQYYTITHNIEDINDAGTDTADYACSNDEKVVYTPTTSWVKVASISALNIPAGDYAFDLHCYSDTTITAEFRIKIGVTEYSAQSNSTADTWEIIPLGIPTLTGTDSFELQVRDETNTNPVHLDCLQIKCENYEGQYRIRFNSGGLGLGT